MNRWAFGLSGRVARLAVPLTIGSETALESLEGI
jgi:hypothetical protein